MVSMVLAGVLSSVVMVTDRLRITLRDPIFTAPGMVVVHSPVLFPQAGEIHPPKFRRLFAVTTGNAFASSSIPTWFIVVVSTLSVATTSNILNTRQVASHAGGIFVQVGASGHS
jgi:hypothetical protein